MNPKRVTLILAGIGAAAAFAVIISQLNSIPRIEGFRYTGRGAGGALEYTHEATELEFVYLKGGEFLMGSPESEAGRQKSCRISMAKRFTAGPRCRFPVLSGPINRTPSRCRRFSRSRFFSFRTFSLNFSLSRPTARTLAL